VFGASFDTVAENLAFHQQQSLVYPLLSDVDRVAGGAYGVVRAADSKYADYPERRSFLIDPAGVLQAVYDVTDVAAHADDVLADLARFTAD
jgi:peroxiredoxin